MKQIYETKEVLKPEKEVDLDTRTYFLDKGTPLMVFAPGLGGSAEQGCSVHNLISQLAERGYSVRTFSPRNSGQSTGHLTIDNYVSDTELVLDDTAQKSGELPYAMGHSMGGYSLGRVLGKEDAAKKGVLLAPLIDITEQNPELINRLLKDKKGRKLASYLLNLMGLDDQDFSSAEDAYSFLTSLYTVPTVGNIRAPSYVMLPGRTNVGIKIKDLEHLKKQWERLQIGDSKVETFPELNHFFTKGRIPNGANFFRKSEKTNEILDRISGFISS
jgi:pimeloyl-ACP methyl ester carboxylesterase